MKSLKFIFLIFCLPYTIQAQEVYKQIIHTNAHVRLKEGSARIHLFENNRFTYYPNFEDSTTYQRGIWEQKGDSLKLSFQDDRIDLLHQALIWTPQQLDQKGVSLKLRWRYDHMPTPENLYTYRGIKDIKISLYSERKAYTAATDTKGFIQTEEISRIDSLRLEDLAFSGSLSLKNPYPESDALNLNIDALKLWQLSGGSRSCGDGSGWIKGWWRMKSGQLYKKNFNLITVYELIE